ncbi:17804_t:CDS:1, partial [Racocetra persica]
MSHTGDNLSIDDNNNDFLYFFTYPDENYTCPPAAYSEYQIYDQFVTQASNIVSYGGTLITVAVYGINSRFGW